MPENEVSKPRSRVNRMLHSNSANASKSFRMVHSSYEATVWQQNEDIAQMYEILSQHGKFKPHPVWISSPKMFRKRLLLLGDSAHLASPNTGAGAQALLDARALREAFLSVDSSNQDEIVEQDFPYTMKMLLAPKAFWEQARKWVSDMYLMVR